MHAGQVVRWVCQIGMYACWPGSKMGLPDTYVCMLARYWLVHVTSNHVGKL